MATKKKAAGRQPRKSTLSAPGWASGELTAEQRVGLQARNDQYDREHQEDCFHYWAQFRRSFLSESKRLAEDRLQEAGCSRAAWRGLAAAHPDDEGVMQAGQLGPELVRFSPKEWRVHIARGRARDGQRPDKVFRESDKWFAARVATAADRALHLWKPHELEEAAETDAFLRLAARALTGDEDARWELERQRARNVDGQRIATDRRVKNYSKRNDDMRTRYEVLVKQGLDNLHSEKRARADAVKTLHREHPHVTVERIREILRQK